MLEWGQKSLQLHETTSCGSLVVRSSIDWTSPISPFNFKLLASEFWFDGLEVCCGFLLARRFSTPFDGSLCVWCCIDWPISPLIFKLIPSIFWSDSLKACCELLPATRFFWISARKIQIHTDEMGLLRHIFLLASRFAESFNSEQSSYSSLYSSKL